MCDYRGSALAALVAAGAMFGTAHAGQTTEQLIEFMHENGSLTDAQYRQLKQAAEEEQAQAAEQPAAPGSTAADWTSKIKLKGDLRLRHEYTDNDANLTDDGDQVDRNRQRIRFRLGAFAELSDQLTVGGGLASGGDDPRSTNQTLDSNFSTKPIQLDYAFAEYAFNDWATVIGGKFARKNYLWQPTDAFWDSDINPEGVSFNFAFDTGLGAAFANTGYWVLNEFSRNEDDPFMYYLQLGQGFSSGSLFGTVAGTYYGYQNTDEPNTFEFSEGTNTDDEFDALQLSAEIGTKVGATKLAFIGDYMVNTETDTSEDTGYGVGGKLGHGKWGFKYIYVDLDANAVPDIFPDSDRFGGGTDIKGHEIAGEYALTDNVELGLDFYAVESKATGVDENLLQADIVIAFP